MRKTKILATFGPSIEDFEKFLGICEYANGIRINFSHADERIARKVRKMIDEVEEELKKTISLLGDTRGPEIRTTNKEDVVFKKGERLNLIEDIGVTNPEALNSLQLGDKVLINDGKLEFVVVENTKGIVIEALEDGVITPRRKVNVPGRELEISFMSKKDIEDIEVMKKYDFDFIAVSFVSSREDIEEVKRIIDGYPLKVISKVENQLSVDKLKEIVENSFGVMVARGDLGVEIPFEKVPNIQRNIIRLTNSYGKISIVATHMLKSMVDSPFPTRAEVSDVANAVFHGADALMLSEETSVGKFPIESVKVMARIIEENEQHFESFSPKTFDYKDVFALHASNISNDLGVNIIAPTMHGTTPLKLAKYRPKNPIMVVTPNKKTAKHLSLTFGCEAVVREYEPVLERAEEIKKAVGLKKALFVFGYPAGNKETNSIMYL